MADKRLEFRFKGNRNYVHGSDIFNAVEGWLSETGAHVMTLSFRSFATKHVICVLNPTEAGVFAEGMAVDQQGEKLPFWLMESADPVSGRYAYDEDAITRNAIIDSDVIRAARAPGYTVIEQVIALTKALNYSRAPDIEGKWVFGQLKLAEPLPENADRYRIRQKVLLANRFSTQDIELDGRSVGEIRFITGQP